MAQGKQANFTGKMLENQVYSRIESAGYVQVKNKEFYKTNGFFSDKIFAKHCFIGNSIYGTSIYTDVLLYNKIKYPNKLAIEIKWQQIGGSVDEKYPYLVLNIKEIFPCKAIIIIDGGGYKEGALAWLKNQVDAKLINVFNISDFYKWINNGNL
jgi:hypothetical protein